MNNKGMTLVELLITFSLLMVIVVGMFNLILDAKIDLDNKQIIKNITEYSNFLNSDIHYDLITKKPFAIAMKQSSSSAWTCKYSSNYDFETDCAVTDSTLSVNVAKTNDAETLNITGSQQINNICNDFYPCAVYAYYDEKLADSNGNVNAFFKVIAFNNDKTKANGYGVKYGNVLETMPDQEYVDTEKMYVTMKIQKDFFKIEYPIYVTGENTNYGFKIVYPFNDISSQTTEDES